MAVRMEFRFILLGKTGSGKSSEGNCVLGKSVFEEKQGMASKTAQCPWEFGNRGTVDIEVMDSPGLFDTHTSDGPTFTETIVSGMFGVSPGPHASIYVLHCDHRMTEERFSALKEKNALLHKQLNQWWILTNGIDAHRDTLRKRDNKAAYFNTPDNRNKRQDECDQDRAAKDDRTEKRNLVAIVTGSVTRSSTGLQTGRTDVFVGNGNLLNESFRQQHNIRNIVTVKAIPLNADVAVDPNTKVRVRVRPVGEGKDSWEHCINQDGNVALPEAQFLCISQLLCGRSSFPASATWFLETPKKCPPSSTLEAVVEIELVTPDAIKRRDASSSAVNLVLSVEIQEKEVPNIYSDPELSSLWLNTDIDRDDRALEEKSQTEAMEK